MRICGLQKTTLLDYPGKVAATVFLGGCNFRCPFCHNSDLLSGDAPEQMSVEELLSFLRRRAHVLEGVCITGGEPTLWPEALAKLMGQIKDLDYQIKLDTNGARPQVLKELCGKGLVDYVAMDVKSGRGQYGRVCGLIAGGQDCGRAADDPMPGQVLDGQTPGQVLDGQMPGQTADSPFPGRAADDQACDGTGRRNASDLAAGCRNAEGPDAGISGAGDREAGNSGTGDRDDFPLPAVEESVHFLMEGHIPYEFRTTAVKGIHTAEDFADIAEWIGGCERYFIQGFVDSGHVLRPGFSAFRRAELEVFLGIVRETIPKAEIRGVDY